MSLSERKRVCLQAMGLTVWQKRDATAAEPGSVPKESGKAGDSAKPVVKPKAVVSPAREQPMTPDSDNDTATLAWGELLQRIAGCTRCPLHQDQIQAVPGVGNLEADWMFIGEAPGKDEDEQGEPFVGRAGQLLNAILHAAGLSREQVYIANTIKCRPPANRNPHHDESDQCYPFLKRQIALLQPKIIVLVGKVAAHRMLDTDQPLGKLRGKIYRYENEIPMVVTYHPAYLLRSPSQKAKVWEDMLLAKTVLAGQTAEQA
ncbi:MAG: uracil-DNA glycosylase [Gammaproteobacteria bacterium]|nr:uracil-DNA glycosylase [Gammaproteobacteria bacterium]